ncbi:hypothetical protein MMC22_011108 [Lobaria immixta]|nr:hypothetical protein [Lobaria immixta]
MPSSNPLIVAAISAVVTATAVLQLVKEEPKSPTEIPTRDIKRLLGPWSPSPYSGILRFGIHELPSGPVITARLADKFCGINEVHLARLPHGEVGTTCWSILLSTIHPSPLSKDTPGVYTNKETANQTAKTRWANISLAPLTIHDSQLCIKISRATLMTLFALTNARPSYSYSSAAGYRSAYASYCGQWSISWPNGKPCIVRLAQHDSHSTETDVYPPSFPARIDKCVEMLAGIVSDGAWKVAFPGRAKEKGPWILKEKLKGFGTAHGSRHLYNMQGGKVFEVDLLAMIKYDLDEDLQKNMLKLTIPCLASDSEVAILFVPDQEAQLLAKAIDCLPWSSLSWSLHRGFRDVLLAFGTPIMNRHRGELAMLLKTRFRENEAALVKRGWAPEFVQGPMADMLESALLSGRGNSGDLVRIVVAVIEVLVERNRSGEAVDSDQTAFWRRAKREVDEEESVPSFEGKQLGHLEVDMAVALTKFFVLEWSQELDYQSYHDLPIDLFLA